VTVARVGQADAPYCATDGLGRGVPVGLPDIAIAVGGLGCGRKAVISPAA
jgi:hypothetical protein